ncbi:GHKL domain-containing protein [Anaerocolumna xylanovorans]|uniref:Signal transduction histidine kinase n=1 Tax=Anaerocolumna xylanovorans DSM 12503 TaxID=1121345 RepID=A0A1M7Y273_9FIRM|nr:GHKL domain-containing protein [Anaerocolumna xylanovorans]SHO46019.1 Signal transduction histidine kinase [Anaerocolumna xylanovorans DSM 12503]
MLVTVFKYCAMIICSFYVYVKLLHIKTERCICLPCVLFLLFFVPEIYFLRLYAAPLSIFIMVTLFTLFVKEVFKTPLDLSFITSVISFGIAFSTFLIAAAVTYPAGYLISRITKQYPSNLSAIICIGILQFLLAAMPFRLKRLQKGMPFLMGHDSNDIGVYISLLLLLASSFFGMSKKADLIYIIPVFFSLICALALFFWWRNRITHNYIEKVKSKEMETLQRIIQEKNEEIEQLKYHNEELSKIIHKDNKLIPAMELAVSEYLLSAGDERITEVRSAKASELIEQLKSISGERAGIIKNYETTCKKLPSTSVTSIDTLLSYMLHKASLCQIEFNLSISGSVNYLVQNLIKESDMNTLLADLIDNAIIATRKSSKKNIIVSIGILDGCYSIDIFDSGEPFMPETLLNLGLKRTTTHVHEGGSGIGLMTAFEISRKYKASFVIECFNEKSLFTKKVSFCFDKLEQYRIKPRYTKEMELLSLRGDIILV